MPADMMGTKLGINATRLQFICEKQFLDLIKKRFGIIIHPHQTADLRKTITNACEKFNCKPEEYAQMLEACPKHSPVLEHLIAGITIGETYFFRDKHQMQLLGEMILPNLISAKRQNRNLSLKIWSAGCASGEEIYTVAMMLKESLFDFKNWTLELLATDINSLTLQKAILGSYSEWSMRSIPEYFKKKYFTLDNHRYQLGSDIRQLVNFSYLNLSENTYPSSLNHIHNLDLIICRNVLIYFDNAEIANVMQKFDKALLPQGYLLLGASDPVAIQQTTLTNIKHEAVLFQKKSQQDIVSKPVISTAKTFSTKILPANSLEQTLAKLIESAKWEEIISVIDKSHEKDRYAGAQGIAYANLGKLEKSIQLCQKCLTIDPTNIQVHFTLAMSLIELNESQSAEAELRKCLFLNNQFILAHFQLGLLLLKNKQYDAGIKSLHNALSIAANKDPDSSVPGFKNLNFGQLLQILRTEIEIYAGKTQKQK